MGSAATADTSAGWAALPGLQQLQNTTYGNIAANSMPTTPNFNIGQINDLLNTYANYARVQSRNDEATYNPAAYASRVAAENQIESALNGNLDPQTQRALMDSNLADVLNSGTGQSLGSTAGFGNNRLSDMYGKGYQAFLASMRGEAGNRFGLTPDQTTLSGSDAAGIMTGNEQNTANAINTSKATLANLGNTATQNAYNQWQQGMQTAGQIASNNANAKNSVRGTNIGALTSLAGMGLNAGLMASGVGAPAGAAGMIGSGYRFGR
jgi:hypothetical protein